DEVRTDVTGRATLSFFGRGEARLDGDTAVRVEDLSSGATAPIRMRLQLTSGRVWSRILRLFNLDSTYAVSTNNVVSTVRGTAFDVSRGGFGSSVWITKGFVEVETVWNGTPTDEIVAEGFKTAANPDNISPTEPLSADDKASEWFRRNMDADDAFVARASDRIAIEYEHRGRVRPDQTLYALAALSERAHLAFAGGEAPRLASFYLGRRLYGIKTLIDEGKSGLALQAFNRLEQDAKEALEAEVTSAAAPYLRIEVANMRILTQGIMPASPLYRFKLKLEDLEQELVKDDEAQALFSRLLSADSRMDEAEGFIGIMQLEEASLSLEAAHQGIENGRRDAEGVIPGTTAERGHAILFKIRALEMREAILRQRLATAEIPMALDDLGSATSTESVATSTEPTPDGNPTGFGTVPGTTPVDVTPPIPPSEPPVNEAPWDRIILAAQPNPIDVGATSQLRLVGSRSDGSTGDLTARATFRIFGNIGTLNGPTLTATTAGSATIEATVTDNGVAKTARTIINVNDAVALSRLSVSALGETTVVQGGQVPLLATAWYSTGFSAPVTAKTVWTSSDSSVGTISGTTFVAGVDGLGPVTITGSYTENDVMESGYVVFTVVPKSVTTGL
ncbi:FecR domain-containing protein, partial [Patescibacteria group bacterium]|nr:FecR domain-containing protein [Patescibacteria group bacterium]MBU1448827.1 FecR domain-containing protein [Patescibacteria group bacterium]